MSFGRLAAISRICFSWRIWCDPRRENHSYAFSDPRKGWRHLYALKSRFLVSSIKASVRFRTSFNSASIASFSRTSRESMGIGVFKRIKRISANAKGRRNRFHTGVCFGCFFRILSTAPTTARSTVMMWAMTSAADQRPSLGQIFQRSAGMQSAARSSFRCARSNFSRMGSSATKSFVKPVRSGRLSTCQPIDGTGSPVQPYARAPTPAGRAEARPLQSRSPGLLEGLSELQNASFAEWGAKNLQPYRELSADLSARDRYARHPCQGSRNCINISKIHLEGIVSALAQFESRHRRGGRYDGIHLGKGVAEILRDQRTHLLPFQVIGIVVACRKHIRSKDDAAFHLSAKPGAPSFPIHRKQRVPVHAQPVAHPVVARQVRTGLGRGDDVVDGNRIVRVRHADLAELAPELAKHLNAGLNLFADIRVHSLAEVLLGDANAQSLDGFLRFGAVIQDWRSRGSRVVGVASGNNLQNCGNVAHICRKWTDPVQGGSEGDKPIPRNAAVAGHHCRDSAKRPRLPNRPPGIG